MQFKNLSERKITESFFKKTVSFLLSLFLLISFLSVLPLNMRAYNDVSFIKWYYTAVKYCTDRNILSGTGDGNFSPERNCTRAEFITMVGRLAFGDVAASYQGQKADFPDAVPGAYYLQYLRICRDTGIAAGYDDGFFYPDKEITREQAMTLFHKALVYLGDKTEADSISPVYTDMYLVSEWAVRSFAVMINRGLVSGTSATTLSPAKEITRAEVAAIIKNYYKPASSALDSSPYLGVDISAYQAGITGRGIASGDGRFAMLRMWYDGGGVVVNGVSNTDRYYEKFYNDCKKAGLQLGAYWFMYPLDTADVIEQADDCIKLLKGKQFELPICLDFEEASVDYYERKTGKKLTREVASSFAKIWCDRVAAAGYEVLIYTNYNMANSNYGLISQDVYSKYGIWLAQWPKSGVFTEKEINDVLSGKTTYRKTNNDPMYNYVRIWQFGLGDADMFGLSGSTIDLNVIF